MRLYVYATPIFHKSIGGSPFPALSRLTSQLGSLKSNGFQGFLIFFGGEGSVISKRLRRGDAVHENPAFRDVTPIHNFKVRVGFLVEFVFIKILIDIFQRDIDLGDQSASVSRLRFWPWVETIGILFLARFFLWGRRFALLILSSLTTSSADDFGGWQ